MARLWPHSPTILSHQQFKRAGRPQCTLSVLLTTSDRNTRTFQASVLAQTDFMLAFYSTRPEDLAQITVLPCNSPFGVKYSFMAWLLFLSWEKDTSFIMTGITVSFSTHQADNQLPVQLIDLVDGPCQADGWQLPIYSIHITPHVKQKKVTPTFNFCLMLNN